VVRPRREEQGAGLSALPRRVAPRGPTEVAPQWLAWPRRPVDLGEEQQCHALLDRAVREFGRIDVLVSNAAYPMSQDGGLDAISSDQFDRVMQTNVYGLFWLCTAAVPRMRPGSTIITKLVGAGVAALTAPHDYAASKAASSASPDRSASSSSIAVSGSTPSRLARCGPR
jgi:NAD(P)-dependent dehydrogenase (short-subunit alcohol dehydrogenase family)